MKCTECGNPKSWPTHLEKNWNEDGGHPFARAKRTPAEPTPERRAAKKKAKPAVSIEKKLEKLQALMTVKGELQEELAVVDSQLKEMLA